MRIKEIASTRVRYGYKRIHILLRREGWKINHKRVYRIYREEGLNLRHKSKRKRYVYRGEEVNARSKCWALDFVSDSLYNGEKFRALTIIDIYTRECLQIYANQRFRGESVVEELDRITLRRGYPKKIRVDNGPEFISKALDAWAYHNGVKLDFSRPGKPTDNAYIESFNGSLRDECLNTNWFLSIEDARDKLKAWQKDYNEYRPYSSLNNQTPAVYAARSG